MHGLYMRNILYTIIIFLWSIALCAQDVGITTTSLQGKTAYLVQAGIFAQQSDAEQLRNSLTSTLSYPIEVKHAQDQGLYIVQVGPIDDLTRAHIIQQQILTTNSPLPPPNSSPLTTHIKPPSTARKTWN